MVSLGAETPVSGSRMAKAADDMPAGAAVADSGDWAKAIRALSATPANAVGLHDRGRLAPGYAADVVVFDPANPKAYLDGLKIKAMR